MTDVSLDPSLPKVEFAFPGALRDALVAAILTGQKTASASLLAEYETGQDTLPEVGDRGVVVDSDDQPVCTIETTGVRAVPMKEVDDEHARSEGEDYNTAEGWRRAHTEFWTSEEMTAELGEKPQISDSTPVVLERFEVIG